MAETAIVDVRDVDNMVVKHTYDGAANQANYGGDWGDSISHKHVAIPAEMDRYCIKADKDGSDNPVITEDTALISLRKESSWDTLRADREAKLDKTDKTMVSDAPVAWDDWTTYREDLRDLPATVGTKTWSLRGDSGQDDLEAKCAGGSDCDSTLEVADPGAADQSLSITVTDNDVKVDLATDSGSAITSTVQEVIDEINNDTDAAALMIASLVSGATGADVVDTAAAKTDLVDEADIDGVTWPTAPAKPVIDLS